MEKTAKPRKKRNRFRVIIILFCVILILAGALAGALIYMRRHQTQTLKPGSRFSLQSITVTGNTHYADEAVIGESGLAVGQSVFSVNKAAAKQKIEAAFPYIAAATVKSPTFNTIEITVTETKVLGAMYGGEKWLVVGANGKILETMDMQSDRPGRYCYLQGAVPAGEIKPGAAAMDERSLRITNTVLAAVQNHQLAGILGIDMRDKTNICLNWKNQLIIALGNESNIDAEIQLLTKALPQILERNGNAVEGRLDLSSYSDDTDSNDKIIYTPQDTLENP